MQYAQQAILDAQHVVFIFPTWWSSIPALLKGFVDRALLPEYAFRYRKCDEQSARVVLGQCRDALALTREEARLHEGELDEVVVQEGAGR